jgi:protein tyrosine phosphatase (PTP) superfamily phosphohydrolase (DUF442 family)
MAILARAMNFCRQHPRLLWRAVLVAALAIVGSELWYIFGGSNCHAVIPGRVYRCAQLSATDLEATIRTHGIRTVINLRGYCAPQSWYLEECRAAHKMDVAMEDVGMSAGRFPSSHELRYLLNVLDRCEYPILIHCKQGADRTGLVSTLILLLQPNTAFDVATRQLSVRYGHVAIGRPGNLDRFLALYGNWLQESERPHSPQALREWLQLEDCPRVYRCRFEPLDFPRSLPLDTPRALHVRAHNVGKNAWRFQTESYNGIHACFAVRDAEDKSVAIARAGMFDAVVQPGDSIDLTLPLPAFMKPGHYRMLVDLVDEVHCIFYQTGAEPLEWEFDVEDPALNRRVSTR